MHGPNGDVVQLLLVKEGGPFASADAFVTPGVPPVHPGFRDRCKSGRFQDASPP